MDSLRQAMPYYPNTRTKYSAYIGNLGLNHFLSYWLKRRTQNWLSSDYTLSSPHALYPLRCRPQTSDIAVFKQIYAQREYSCLDHLASSGPGLIVDCGANAGFSTAYLLSRFTEAEIIAIEPDPTNFRALCTNVGPYGPRAHCLEAAVWSHPTRLNLNGDAGDGKEWSRTVSESDAQAVGTHVNAIDIGTVLKDSGHTRIRLLKIDIEGAEAVVFGAANASVWLPSVDVIVIELHGKDCTDVFSRVAQTHGFQLRRHLELTIAERTTA